MTGNKAQDEGNGPYGSLNHINLQARRLSRSQDRFQRICWLKNLPYAEGTMVLATAVCW